MTSRRVAHVVPRALDARLVTLIGVFYGLDKIFHVGDPIAKKRLVL